MIFYIAAPCGSGKTYDILKKVKSLVVDGQNVILAVPTTALADQCEKSLEAKGVSVVKIHKDTTINPVREINSHLLNHYPEPHVVIITQSAFERLGSFDHSLWHLFVDEIPQVTRFFDKSLPVQHKIITNHLDLGCVKNGDYRNIVSEDWPQLRQLASEGATDEVSKQFQEIAYTILSQYWQSYVVEEDYGVLLENDGSHNRLTISSVLQPSIYDGFKTVHIAGAHFIDSILYKFWSALGTNLIEEKEVDLLFKEHDGSNLTLYYFFDELWSKKLAKKENNKILQIMQDEILKSLNGQPFIYAENKSLPIFSQIPKAKKLHNSPHGLNLYRNHHNVVYFPARNPTPNEIKFLKSFMHLSDSAIRTGIHFENAYQAVMRGSLRNRGNTNQQRIYVPDFDTASWLQTQFPQSKILKIDVDFGTLLDALKRGRPTAYKTNADRQKAYKKRTQKEELEQFFLKIDPNVSGLQFKTNFPENEDIFLNRNFVTFFQGSLFEHVQSTTSITVQCNDIGDFESQLQELYFTKKLNRKEDNHLISPAYFDSNKAKDTKRGLKNVVFARGLWLDFDSGNLTENDIDNILSSYRITIFSSFSSTLSSRRFRVFLPTEGSMNAEQYKVVAGVLQDKVEAYCESHFTENRTAKHSGLDVKKLHAASLFYLPCQPFNNSNHYVYFETLKGGERKVLDEKEIIISYIKKTDIEKEPTVFDRDQVVELDAFEMSADADEKPHSITSKEAAIEKWRQVARTPHKDNENFFRLGQGLRRAGCDWVEVESILQREAIHAHNSGDRIQRIRSIITSIKGYERGRSVNANAREVREQSL